MFNRWGGASHSPAPAAELDQPGPASPVDHAVSLALWAAGLAWLVPVLSLHGQLWRRYSPKRLQWSERIYTRGQIALTGSRWRARVDPAIDPERPYIFLQNHTNIFDHCAAYCATPHVKQGVQLDELFDVPIYGSAMRHRGTIPVARGKVRGLLELRERIRAEYRAGNSILAFPEGTRTRDGRLGQLQPGMFRIAQQLEAAIVPVTVTGLYQVLRRGSWIIRPGQTITVHCDAPIETRGTGRGDVRRLVHQVSTTMSGHLDAYWRDPRVAPAPQRVVGTRDRSGVLST